MTALATHDISYHKLHFKQVDIKISQGKTEIVNFAKMKVMMNTIFYLINLNNTNPWKYIFSKS
jgi:hypothetical protein